MPDQQLLQLIDSADLTLKQKRLLRSFVRHRKEHETHAVYQNVVQHPRRVIRELVEMGIVTRIPRFEETGQQKPNGYAINLEALRSREAASV